jgi:hypothetical protein
MSSANRGNPESDRRSTFSTFSCGLVWSHWRYGGLGPASLGRRTRLAGGLTSSSLWPSSWSPTDLAILVRPCPSWWPHGARHPGLLTSSSMFCGPRPSWWPQGLAILVLRTLSVHVPYEPQDRWYERLDRQYDQHEPPDSQDEPQDRQDEPQDRQDEPQDRQYEPYDKPRNRQHEPHWGRTPWQTRTSLRTATTTASACLRTAGTNTVADQDEPQDRVRTLGRASEPPARASGPQDHQDEPPDRQRASNATSAVAAGSS